MTVLDASALVAALSDEPARPVVERILRAKGTTSISAANLAEAVDHMVRVRGHGPTQVRDLVYLLIASGLEVEPVWLQVMWLATALRAEHYHREVTPVSIADCICIATAISLDTDLATTDSPQARVARAAGVDVIPLADSNGELP